MFCFLQYVRKKMNILNLDLQSEHFRLQKIDSMVSAEHENILSYFVEEEYFMRTKLCDIDPSNSKVVHKRVDDIFLGGRAISLLEQEPFVDHDCFTRFKHDCLNFLVELCLQTKSAFA